MCARRVGADPRPHQRALRRMHAEMASSRQPMQVPACSSMDLSKQRQGSSSLQHQQAPALSSTRQQEHRRRRMSAPK